MRRVGPYAEPKKRIPKGKKPRKVLSDTQIEKIVQNQIKARQRKIKIKEEQSQFLDWRIIYSLIIAAILFIGAWFANYVYGSQYWKWQLG